MEIEKLKCPYHDTLCQDIRELKQEIKTACERLIRMETSYNTFANIVTEFMKVEQGLKDYIRNEDEKLWKDHYSLDEKVDRAIEERTRMIEKLDRKISRYSWIWIGVTATFGIFLTLIQVGVLVVK